MTTIAQKRRYGSRSIKRRPRRTKAEVASIREAMYDLLAESHPMSVRQVFYQLVSLGVVPKTEAAYKSTVIRLLTAMRREKEIPYNWLADATRWMRKPESHSSLGAMLELSAELYRRDLWLQQDSYVEVWLEKDALAGVVFQATSKWDVPLMVTRGYPSLSFLSSAAEGMPEDKPCYLYYFGDHDPSGVDISRKTEATLRELAPEVELHFERVAILPWQIEEWELPTRPTKRTDTRAKRFKGKSVEVDAIQPDTLRDLVNDCIVGHIGQQALEQTLDAERMERETLEKIAACGGELNK